MAYEYGMFVSYRHDDVYSSRVHQHFRPFLESLVSQALNRRAGMFVDREGIAAGEVWPAQLRNALATHARWWRFGIRCIRFGLVQAWIRQHAVPGFPSRLWDRSEPARTRGPG